MLSCVLFPGFFLTFHFQQVEWIQLVLRIQLYHHKRYQYPRRHMLEDDPRIFGIDWLLNPLV